MSSLRQRVLTAAVLIPLFVAGVVVLPPLPFALLLAAVTLAGAWEWAAFAGMRSVGARAAYTGLFALVLGAAAVLMSRPSALFAMLLVAMLWWMLALGLVLYHQRARSAAAVPRWLRVLAGWTVLVPAWVALVALHRQDGTGPYLVLFLLGVIWCADIAAFFAGRRWGRRRLASRVSPGKTWEGVAGAMLVVLVLAAITAAILGIAPAHQLLFVALSVMTVAASVLGDLAESLFKRQAGLKDSGNLLPGHGGVLDRIDSVTAAAPLFFLGLYWLEGFR